MYIYILLPICVTLITIIYYSLNKKPSKAYLIVAMLPLFIISSLRNRIIGADYSEYVRTFHDICRGGSSYMENGYIELNRLVAHFTDNYIWLGIAVNVFIFVPVIIYFSRRVDRRYWPVCMMIFLLNPYIFIQTTFNALRQGCAVGIMILGYLILIEKKGVKGLLGYVLFIAIASQFHKIAWVVLILLFINGFKWKAIHWRIIAIICCVLNIAGISNLLLFLTNKIGAFSIYYNYESSLLNQPIYIVFIFLFILLLSYKYEGLYHNEEEKKIIDLYMFSLCFLIIAVTNDMIYRIYTLFAIISLAAVPLIWERFGDIRLRLRIKQEKAMLKIGYITYYFGFYSFYIGVLSITENTHYVPFLFYFQ